MEVGLYIHVPFCVRKCHYCDFYSLPMADGRGLEEAFVDAVCREMEIAARAHASLGPLDAPTIFLGGGTPSLLSPAQLGRILETARACFRVAPQAEITLESNPGTLDREKARAFRELGVNRVSLGVQSFNDAELRALGRIHTAAEAEAAVSLLRATGFDSLSLDLMFGLPGQTLASWHDTLRRAVALQPEHLSAYSLIVEPDTPFATWQREGRLSLPTEETDVAMFEAGIAVLTAAGYEHYEVSNFARPGQRSRHNQIYWRNEPYLGFGPSAVSYLGGVRAANVRSLSRYLEAVARGERPVETAERIEGALEMGETMMVGLRLLEGMEHARFRERFGVPPEAVYGEQIRRLVAAGLLRADDARLSLTHQGLLFANDVMAEFLP
ncbi:MAG: radical SAM family heme chaperone HemW [Armatimonadetes bacterium]|nr:radical SAM family heme chaperone HemW [Armatimonadota bacterium]